MIKTSITLELPQGLYDRAHHLAQAAEQSLEGWLISHLAQVVNNPLLDLPLDEQVELNALGYLSDDALWTIAREKMPTTDQDRLQALMMANNFGSLTPAEGLELQHRVEQGQRLMLRKAQASYCLTQRGYIVRPEDLDE